MKGKEREYEDAEEGVMTTVKNSREYIPLDLTAQILQRLPTKALLKFTSVAKTWCSEIRSQPFVNSFLSMSRPRLLLAFKLKHDNETQLLFFSAPHLSQESIEPSIMAKHEMTISKTSPGGYYMIPSDSIRGFICIYYHRKFMVCNPSTRHIINLPEKHDFDPGTMKYYMHLGYDPTNDQYKVLCMITRPGTYFVSEHSVYTLGCRQSSSYPWRRVESGISNYVIPRIKGVYINGVVYYEINQWMSYTVVASFDFCSERLGKIKLPKEILWYLTKYQGKLAGLTEITTTFSVWVLEDVKNQIWSKIFVLSQSFWSERPSFSGTTDAGEFVFAEDSGSDDFYVLYLNIDRNIVRKVKLVGVKNHDEVRGRSEHLSYEHFMSCGHVDNIMSIKSL